MIVAADGTLWGIVLLSLKVTLTAVVVGAGAALYPEVFPEARGPLVPDPAVLARLAITRASRGADQPAEPLYLRRPDVTPAAGRKRATA